MLPTICYVLTSAGDDAYAAMSYISAESVRRLYPKARIVLLCDEVTGPNLTQKKAPVLNLIDHVIRVETGSPVAKVRSRFVKTSMRQLIDGDFVYLDVDVVPIRRFDEIASGDADVAAANDTFRVFPGEFYSWKLLRKHWRSGGGPNVRPTTGEVYRQMGWSFPPKLYLNTGVVFFRDTPAARKLGRLWHENWSKTTATGKNMDQYGFNRSLDTLPEVKARVLPYRYNAMVRFSPWFAHRAKILHFHSMGKGPQEDSVMFALAQGVMATGRLDRERFDRLHRTGYPWLDENSFLLRVAAGNYRSAVGLLGRRLLGRRGSPGPAPVIPAVTPADEFVD